jgi:hypothetical protein
MAGDLQAIILWGNIDAGAPVRWLRRSFLSGIIVAGGLERHESKGQ